MAGGRPNSPWRPRRSRRARTHRQYGGGGLPAELRRVCAIGHGHVEPMRCVAPRATEPRSSAHPWSSRSPGRLPGEPCLARKGGSSWPRTPQHRLRPRSQSAGRVLTSPGWPTRGFWLAGAALRRIVGPDYSVRQQLPLALNDLDEPEPDAAVVVDEHPTTAVLVVKISDATLAFDAGRAPTDELLWPGRSKARSHAGGPSRRTGVRDRSGIQSAAIGPRARDGARNAACPWWRRLPRSHSILPTVTLFGARE